MINAARHTRDLSSGMTFEVVRTLVCDQLLFSYANTTAWPYSATAPRRSVATIEATVAMRGSAAALLFDNFREFCSSKSSAESVAAVLGTPTAVLVLRLETPTAVLTVRDFAVTQRVMSSSFDSRFSITVRLTIRALSVEQEAR